MAKNNTFADWFNTLRNNNLTLVSSLKKIKVQIENIKSLDVVEKGEAVELSDYVKGARVVAKNVDDNFENRKGLYYSNNADEASKYFDAIFEYSHIVLPIIDDLIENFNRENKEITNYFGKRENDVIESNVQITSSIIRHNQEVVGLVQELSKYIPAIIEIENKAIGAIDMGIDQLAENFFKVFDNLTNSIENKRTVADIFQELRRILFYLENVQGTMKSLTSDHGAEFIYILKEHIKIASSKKMGKNAIKFANKVLTNSFEITLTNLNKFLEESGTDTKNGKILLIDRLDDEKVKEKILEFLNQKLHDFYKNTSDYENSFKKKINEAVVKKQSSISDFKNEYTQKYYALVEGKFSKLNFSSGKKAEDCIFIVDGMEDVISFKNFNKKYLNAENKNIIKSASIYLTTLINSKDNKNPFKYFLQNQINSGIINNDSRNNEDDDETDKKLSTTELSNLIQYIADFLTFTDESPKEDIKNKWNQIYPLIFSGAKSVDNGYYCSQFKIFSNTIKFTIKDNREQFNRYVNEALLLNSRMNLISAQKLLEEIMTLIKNSGNFSDIETSHGSLNPTS